MQFSVSPLSKNMAPEFRNGQFSNGSYNRIFHFFGLRENPFHISPDPRYLSFTRQTQEAFDALIYGIQTRQGLLALTGEVGTGKTTLINCLLEWLRQRQTPTSFIFNARLNVDDLFDFVLADFGITCESKQKVNKLALLTAWLLARYRAGKTPILIVDEAQGLPSPVLEEICLLSNLETPREKLLQIVLVGQPELQEKLSRPELRQLRQRVVVRCKIGPLNSSETRGYIHRRLHVAGAQDETVFLPDAMDAVHACSRGIPRVINTLCEHALISAYAEQIRPVSLRIVKVVAQEFQYDKIGLLDTRFDFNKTRSTGSTTTQLISTIVQAKSVEPAAPASTEQRNILMSHAPVRAVDKNPKPPSALTKNPRGIANLGVVERVAAKRYWMTSFSFSLYLGCLWHDKSIAMHRFPILHHAASSVVRWLQRPVRPVHAPRWINQGPASDHLLRKINFAPIQEEIRMRFSRLWHDKSIAMHRFPILHHAASSVVRWLRQPVHPVHAPHRINHNPASDHHFVRSPLRRSRENSK
jgi:general secretion pathway protein A